MDIRQNNYDNDTMVSRLDSLYDITQNIPTDPREIKATYNRLKDINKQYKGWGLEGLSAEHAISLAKQYLNNDTLNKIDLDLNRGRVTYKPNENHSYYVQPQTLNKQESGKYVPKGIQIGATWRF